MNVKIYIVLFASGVLVAGCDQSLDKKADTNNVDARYDRSTVTQIRLDQGRALFLQNCAVCHGNEAQGTTDWRKRDKDGNYPPPPLDGTAHAWHHPKMALVYTIKNGTKALGGTMPAWKDSLTDDEIESIIVWFQAKWPDQLYRAWVKRDKESIKRKK